jgi:gliding motility-associated-like protein
MMRKFHYILIFTTFLSVPLLAQRETVNWYFGDKAGLNFNQGFPMVLTNGRLSTTEGCSTVSDANGDLLFYTDGSTVWNKNHSVMSNGVNLKGDLSSSQSALIVPNISNSDIYYIFTADVAQSYFNGGNGNGFNYSIVDLSFNGGLGKITSKNINLLVQGSEKVSAVSAMDGSGFWVVTQAKNNFYSYKVNGNGVNTTPVVSVIGPDISNFSNIRGCIKIAPNGKKIAVSHPVFQPNLGGSLNLFDFDVNTGVISNEEVIATGRVFYGVEFSSKSKRLYASGMLIDDEDGFSVATKVELYQYDLESPNITRTEYLINSYSEDIPGELAGALQIAFDKRIYHSITNDKLSIIREPNLPNVSSDYREYSIDLDGRLARFGLPSYIQSSFESIFTIESLCFNDATQFIMETDDAIQSVNWNFGDPSTGINNTSTLLNPIHAFSGIGIFEVILTVNFVNRESKTYIEFVEINEAPVTLNTITLTQCDIDDNDDGITLFNLSEVKSLIDINDEDLQITYFKSLQDVQNNENALNEAAYENEFNNQIIFAKAFENVECFSVTEITLKVTPFSDLGTYSETFICNPNNADDTTLNFDTVRAQLLQDFSNTDITFYGSENDALLENNELVDDYALTNSQTQELYFRIEETNACKNIGRLEIRVVSKPVVQDQITIFCANRDNILDAGNGFVSYLWSTGEITRTIQIEQQGEYWVEVSHGADCSDTIHISSILSKEIEIDKIIINDFRADNSITILLKNYDGILRYSIDGGLTFSSSNRFDNVASGLYNLVIIRDDCNTVSETVLVGGFPKYFTPNGDGYHDSWQLKKPEFFKDAEIKIYDRFGKVLKTLKAFESWDGKVEGALVTPTDYWFSIKQNQKTAFGHFSLKL